MRQHRARAVAVGDVAELMGDDPSELVGGLGLLDQAVEDIDDPARQRVDGLVLA